MVEYIASGDTGRFLGLFNAIVNAGFAFAGIEMVAVAAGETENPRYNIPKAINRLFWRILFFYILGTLAIGVIVPYNDDRLLNGGAGVASSPWVIGISRAGIKVLPSIINAVVLVSAASAGNALLYSGSRYLLALAEGGQAPKFLLKCTKRGVPIYCVLCTGALAPLTYMAVSSDSARVFSWFANLVTTAALFTWCSICIAYIGFDRALHAQGINQKEELAFKGFLQPYISYISLGFFIIVIIFNGFSVFIHGHWDTQKFVVSYVGIPYVFIFLLSLLAFNTDYANLVFSLHYSLDGNLLRRPRSAPLKRLIFTQDASWMNLQSTRKSPRVCLIDSGNGLHEQ